jgi:hypothetical protein
MRWRAPKAQRSLSEVPGPRTRGARNDVRDRTPIATPRTTYPRRPTSRRPCRHPLKERTSAQPRRSRRSAAWPLRRARARACERCAGRACRGPTPATAGCRRWSVPGARPSVPRAAPVTTHSRGQHEAGRRDGADLALAGQLGGRRARPDRRSAREGRLAAPPGQVGDGLPDRRDGPQVRARSRPPRAWRGSWTGP